MTQHRWAIAAFVLAGALLILSAVWSYVAPATLFWDEQDQRVYADAYERLHQAGHGLENTANVRSPQRKEAARQEFEAATQQFDAEKERLDRAQSAIDRTPTILFISAVVAIGAGLALYRRAA